jgi:hypothetical protein
MADLENKTLAPAGAGTVPGKPALIRRVSAVLLAGLLFTSAAAAEPDADELVSFRCALAIDAVLAKLDEEAQNLVIKQALSTIDDKNGQMVCISMNADEMQVRLQSTDMKDSDNRLVFSLDAKTYKVRKTFYGR